MSRPSTRQHRLPKRTDYMLIPAPLDLSLPLATEKSSLPAIIVTPCSPSSTHDFAIAFLADPPKPTLRKRLSSFKPLAAPGMRTRAVVFLLIMLVILACHFITHSLAARYPIFEFGVQAGGGEEGAGGVGWLTRGPGGAVFGREFGGGVLDASARSPMF